jgi:hypothetical protein
MNCTINHTGKKGGECPKLAVVVSRQNQQDRLCKEHYRNAEELGDGEYYKPIEEEKEESATIGCARLQLKIFVFI